MSEKGRYGHGGRRKVCKLMGVLCREETQFACERRG